MILSRITRALREQNWFAVALEFVIVIAGVVIGFQVTEWNADRIARQDEALILTRLETDYQELSDRIDWAIERNIAIFDALSRLMDVIQSEEPQPANPEQFRQDLDTAFTGVLGPLRSSTIVELTSAGNMNLIRDDTLRANLLVLDESVQRTASLFDILDAGNRAIQAPFISTIIFENTISADGTPQTWGVIGADLETMRANPAVLSTISMRRRNIAFMLDWLHRLRQDVDAMQTQIEAETTP